MSIHRVAVHSSTGVDIVRFIHNDCGQENQMKPAFWPTYTQSTGPTTSSTLSKFKQQKQNQGKNK